MPWVSTTEDIMKPRFVSFYYCHDAGTAHISSMGNRSFYSVTLGVEALPKGLVSKNILLAGFRTNFGL